MLKLIKQNYVLLSVFILASILRILLLSSYPHGFFTDEVVSGYVGRFLILNTHDIHGNLLPLFHFDKFGDYRSILPMYITGLFSFIFGVNVFAVRVVPAIFGSAIVFPMYYFVMVLTKNKQVSLISSFFIAILPWHIVLSRAQSEGIMGLTIFLIAMVLSFPSNKNNSRKIVFSGLLFAATYLFYPPFRILTPAVTFGYIFLMDKGKRRNHILLFVILTILTLAVLSTPWGKGRAEQTSLFSSKEIAEKIQAINENAATALGPDNVLLARAFHNKPIGYAREFAKQYFTFLSPSYLFFNGGLPYRYIIPEGGLVYVTFAFFFVAFVALKNEELLNNKKRMFLVYLLLVSILPSALTYEDSPNIHRSLVMILPLITLASIGFYKIINFVGGRVKWLVVAASLFAIVVEFVYLQHQYIYQAPSFQSYLRDDGLLEAARWIKDNQGEYTKIYATSYEDLAVYYLFETKNFDKSLMGNFEKNPIFMDKIGNVEFFRDYCPHKHDSDFILRENEIIIANGECSYDDFSEVKRIVRKDSTVAFKLFASSK